MINKDRLAQTFQWLVKTDSISREEIEIASKIKLVFSELGAKTIVDNAKNAVGGTTGNLIVRFKGNCAGPALMLNAHMDTVEPGRGVRPGFKNGLFTSDGDTILGADDKSAIAILIETLRVIQENNLPHPPLELVFTVCEEIGLQGAKNLDYSLLTASCGYALDAMDTQGIITRAPGANRFEIKIYGKEAHAGAAPEQGINAILIGAKAISSLKWGRMDAETTCNIGTICGGIATNVVPNLMVMQGEVRSHNPKKLADVSNQILSAFEKAAKEAKIHVDDNLPRVEIQLENDFPSTHIPEDHPIVTMAQQAARNLGRSLVSQTTGGGADANIFFEKGIAVGVLGTGMKDMHTVRESVALADMVSTAELTIEIIRLHAKQHRQLPLLNQRFRKVQVD